MGIANKEIENKEIIAQKIIPKYYGLNKQKTSNFIQINADQIKVELKDEDFCLLNDGAMILIDNTLWKGLVLGQVISFTSSILLFYELYFLNFWINLKF